MQERRRRRSAQPQQAVSLYLEAVRAQAGLEAIALTTSDGLLIGGAGEQVDLEWMGAIGAASDRPSVRWDERTLHVEPLNVHDFDLRVTSAGKRVPVPAIAESLERILPLG